MINYIYFLLYRPYTRPTWPFIGEILSGEPLNGYVIPVRSLFRSNLYHSLTLFLF